jgi:hypothetical protein
MGVLPTKFLPPLKHKNPDAPVFILHSSGEICSRPCGRVV